MDALRDELLGKLDNKIAFTIPVFGGIPVPDGVRPGRSGGTALWSGADEAFVSDK